MNNPWKHLGLSFAFLFVAIGTQPVALAATVPLVLGTSSDDVIVNFDFSSEAAPPPYTNTILSFFHVDVSTTAKVVFDYYDNLNGVGLLGSDSGAPTLTPGPWEVGTGCPSATAYCAGVLDGVFSIGLHLSQGAATFSDSPDTPESLAFNSGSEDIIAAVEGTLVSNAVPEPGTLVLLALGLLGVGLRTIRA
jgi:PEP-CTERM motif-containing protein